MKKNYLPILTLIVTLMATSLACSLSTDSGGPTAEPTRSIPISTEAARNFEQAFQQPTIDPTAGTETVQFTEEQITSYVAYQLAQDPTQPIHNPQIYLENNQVILKGQIVTDVLNSDGQVTATISVDASGKPKFTITSAEFGSIQIPPELLDSVTSMLDSAIQDHIQSDQYRIKSITIADHKMTIVVQTTQ